ncbi:Hsp70 family protein [Geodermatophilus sp. URMC 61]|uniref:Hsp70 family protein n=1 Tax=Geodermatophilus sp. URMC 61 TaxID=3423411 RepID=UPI00406CFD38
MRNGEYGLGIDVGDGAVSAAVCGSDGRAVPLPLGEGPVATAVGDDGRVALVPADGTAGRTPLVARVGDPVPVYAGGRPVPAAELVADAVRCVRGLAAEQEGRPDAWTVVTVPPSWAGHRWATLAAALTAAGVPRFSLVSSAVAAVAAHVAAGDLPPEPTVAVYDLGAGSLDTALVGPGPDRPLVQLAVPPAPLPWGGRDVDDAVLAHVLDCLGAPPGDARALRGACREAKEALSTATVARVATDGPDGPVRLTREELDEVLAGPVRGSAEALAATVAAAGLSPTDVDAVVLAGGGVRVPLVAEVLSDELGRPLVVGGDPALTPALGAATLAAEALAAEALPEEAPAAEPAVKEPTTEQDGAPDVVHPSAALPRPRTPRRRSRPGSPPRAATRPAQRPGGRLRRGVVVAGLVAGLLLLGPAAAGLFDAVLTPGPAGQDAAADADAGEVIAHGSAAVGGSTARAAGGDEGGAPRPVADPTGSPRTSLAAAIATAARTGAPSAPGSAAPARDRTTPGSTASAPGPSRAAPGGTPSGTASTGAPAPGTAGRPSPSRPVPVVEEPTGSGRPTTSQPPAPQPPTSRSPVPDPPVSEAPVPDPPASDPPTGQPPASPEPVDQTPAPVVEQPTTGQTGPEATPAPTDDPPPSTAGPA